MATDLTSERYAPIERILTPDLDPLLWRSEPIDDESVWHAHVPFAHWLVRVLAPRCIVEIGVRDLVSHAAFCRAARRDNLGARCFAVLDMAEDTASLAARRAVLDEHFAGISTLVHPGNDALAIVPDGTVDLLHIDGRQTHLEVRERFDAWRGKLSPRGVVLLRDIAMHEPEFGAWRLWAELRARFPGFEFPHAGGLGVLAVGPDCPAAIVALTGLGDARVVGAVRDRFARFGERHVLAARLRSLESQDLERARRQELSRAQARATETALATARSELEMTHSALTEARAFAWSDRAPSSEADRWRSGEAMSPRSAAEAALQRIQGSPLWRGTWRARAWLCREPLGWRRPLHWLARGGWRAVTPRLNPLRSDVIGPMFDPAASGRDPHRGLSVCYVVGEPDTPGEVYRVRRHAAACEAIGARVTILRVAELPRHVAKAGKFQVVVIWRAVWTETTAAFVREARRQGARIVFDIDDLVIDPALAQAEIVVRLGYAAGSRTHQRDFAEIANVLPRILRAHPECRLVLFRKANDALVDPEEFPALALFANQIEWREMVPLAQLPDEIARFDVNLVPLQRGNPFCAAKSELKYFEAALAGVCTVASPVGPYARAIRHGVTGFLANGPEEWEATLTALLRDPARRRKVARSALNEVLWTHGPDRRTQLMRRVLAEWMGGAAAADAFALELRHRAGERRPGPTIVAGEVVFEVDHLEAADITIAVPLYNYANTVVDALNSARNQTRLRLDLVIVDDCSTDQSLATALTWARANADRFNRLVVIRHLENAGLGPARNTAFSAAETEYVLPLDADNLLRPRCCEVLLAAIAGGGAAYAYPVIQEFGGRDGRIGEAPYHPSRFVGGNYIDAMALIAKSAWSAAGGYASMRLGWEDYEFWCALAELGLRGVAAGGPPLADYRVHAASMLARVTETAEVKPKVISEIEQRHPWLAVARPVETRSPAVVLPLRRGRARSESEAANEAAAELAPQPEARRGAGH